MKYLSFMREIPRLLLFVLLLFVSVNTYSQKVEVKASEVKVVFAGEKYYLHEIKQGQTLYSICRFYNVDLQDVLKANKKNEAIVQLGEVVRLPDNGQIIGVDNQKKKDDTQLGQIKKDEVSFIHTTVNGETLFSLSELYDISMASILNLNPTLKVEIETGKQISIPCFVYDNIIYTVSRRDTRKLVLERFKMTYVNLLNQNTHIKTSKLFKRGTDLNVTRKRKIINPLGIAIVSTEDIITSISLNKQDSLINLPLEENINSLYSNFAVEEFKPLRGKVKFAIFLPFYLEMNDKLNNITETKSRTKLSNKIFKKSKMFIKFYQGVLLAVDSLRNQGVNIELLVFDTRRDVAKVKSIVEDNKLDDVDFIIGPVYSDTFEILSNYVKGTNIPLISPLSNNVKPLKANKNVFQINTSLDALCKHIADYVSLDLENKNIVVIQKDTTVLNANKLIDGLEYHLFEKGEKWNKDNVSYKKISIDEHGLFGIRRTLSDSCENIIILPSTNRPIVENVIRNLNVLSKKYKIKLIGFSAWLKFSSMDPYVLFNLNTSIFSSRYIDYNNRKVDNFVNKFRSKYNSEPNDYAFRAYDICFYFSQLSRKYHKTYLGSAINLETEQIQSNFSFKRNTVHGGYENVGLLKILYKDNFTIKLEKIHLGDN